MSSVVTATLFRRSSALLRLAAAGRSNSISYSRLFVTRTLPLQELPYHLVVGLPALSPTMESGTLAEYYVAEGDSFSAGDGIAKIETDKAAMDFEAQDDGYVAKILMPAGQGNDIAVGTPIMITVEEEADVAAFKDYVYKEEKVAPVAAPAASEPPAAAAPKAEPVAPAKPAVAAAPPVTPPPPSAAATPASKAATTTANNFSTAWGLSVNKASPLAKSLASKQTAFVEKYGTTGQLPI